ncbi:Phosphoethanolamine N-methyltransferase [Parachaetomium inaequale]|uniref:Phosphoethanolamine N-methyltransferase n=1 Tax=Parachaetomium inaequale TaxID=2588326 RepID=A0AAN6ST08_9PEZI|nr:Phosphoethanolamine N-methyltransferase [Parachaetomium inaequale]
MADVPAANSTPAANPAPVAVAPQAVNSSPAANSPPAANSAAAAEAPANTGILEADDDPADNDDADSALGVNAGDVSDTTSVMSSIFRYREQHGRTYHAYRDDTGQGNHGFKPYFLPNDETENERLDLQHNLAVLTQDSRLYICPAGKDKPLNRVLDAGCGTGIWAIDFGDEHPETSVVGVDISPSQPSFVPLNVEFFVDDLELEWNYVTPFDLIYARYLTGSIKDWPRFYRQAYQHLQPGGWIEVCDYVSPMACDDGTLKADSALKRWSDLLIEASVNLGATLASTVHYKQQMIDAGFQNVVQVEYKWPVNTWPKDPKHKEIGAWAHLNTMDALQALSYMSFTNGLGWSTVEVEALLVDVRKELKNRNIHAYWPM